MHKRKTSADASSRPKSSLRRPSTGSLHARQNVNQQKQQKLEKQKSTQNFIEETALTEMMTKVLDTGGPKTGFGAQDRLKDIRSCSSPRLKYFPAEKIKKLDSPPPFSPKPIGALLAQQDPRQGGVLYVGDNGQGDAAAMAQQFQKSQQQEGMQTASQQQVPNQQAIHQMGQMNPQSECAISQQVPNVQTHRPFVARDYATHKPPQASSYPNHPQASGTPRPMSQPAQLIDQSAAKAEDQAENIDADYERQPVGGRNAAQYRRMMTTKLPGPPQAQLPMDSATMNQFNANQQPMQDQYGIPGHASMYRNFQTPQQIYQQMQQNLAQQQQMQQRAMNYQMQMERAQAPVYNYQSQQVGGQIPAQGMTSPQDMTVNQMKNSRMMAPGRYTVNPQIEWMKNNQTSHLRPYSVDVINSNQPLYRAQQQQQYFPQYQQQLAQQQIPQQQQQMHLQHQKQQQVQFQQQQQQNMQRQNLQQQNLQQQHLQHQHFQQQQQQRQQFHLQQQQQPPPQMQQQQVHQQLYRYPVPGNMIMQGQQNMPGHDHAGFNQQMVPNQQFSSPHLVGKNGEVQNAKRQPLKFTPGMIRDQEKLLATMKQQGVPVDIMRRQFEKLLTEQRKHLQYLEQLYQQDHMPERKRATSVPPKKKQLNEKPDWMIHLTPPRLSYMEIEKLRAERRKEREAQQMQVQQQQQQINYQHPYQHLQQQYQQSYSQPQQQQYQQLYQQQQHQQFHQQQQHQQFHQQQQLKQQQQRMNEAAERLVPGQVANQQNHMWQQQQQKAQQQYGNAYNQPYIVPGVGNEPAKQVSFQQNVPHYQFAYQQPVQQHRQSAPLQQQYQFYQGVPRQYPEPYYYPNQQRSASANPDDRPTTGPSSLLKMRVYKREIRPQRQNNGLQDPEIAKKHLEELQLSADTRKGLEYLINLAPKKPELKLNGIQDRSAIEAEFEHRFITSSYQPTQRNVSANGLENGRNPNNPPPQKLTNHKKIFEEFMKEYPRQKQDEPRNCYSVPAERENGTVAVGQQQMFHQQQLSGQIANGAIAAYNDKNPMTMARGNVQPYRFENGYPQHYQQMQQYQQNAKNFMGNLGEGDVVAAPKFEQNKGNFDGAGGDVNGNMNGGTSAQMAEGKMPFQRVHYSQPSIHETKTIGGVRYLARKQDYIPNQQIVPPETLMANRHLQPSIVC